MDLRSASAQAIEQRYGFSVTPGWLDHLRLSSVRFPDGSGSFVSPNGLVLTNHHVALEQLQKISTPQKNYVADGFYARTRAEEVKSADAELNVLMSTEDITARVAAAAARAASSQAALEARKAEIARIEKESVERTGLRSDVVTLYQGAQYWLYRYKKYTDVRLVFAPEQQMAFFGGDPDNFTYPRHDLDFALFRVYENDAPIHSDHFLKWNAKGAAENELVFVTGHPGSTDRDDTVAELETERDVVYPANLQVVKRRIATSCVSTRAAASKQARQANGRIFGLENALKAYTGEYNGLLDAKVFAKKTADERALRDADRPQARVESRVRERLGRRTARPGNTPPAVQDRTLRRSFEDRRSLRSACCSCSYAAELAKPDAGRLDGFHEAQLPIVDSFNCPLRPRSTRPSKKSCSPTRCRSRSKSSGPSDPFVKTTLAGRSPKEAAADARGRHQAGRSGRPQGADGRRRGGDRALDRSARRARPGARSARPCRAEDARPRRGERVVGGAREDRQGALCGLRHLRLSRRDVHAAALVRHRQRLSDERHAGALQDDVRGLYDRSASFDDKPPFKLAPRFVERRAQVEMTTPLDFVTTNDIIGGNSGSPVVNRAGELVGLIFDGNIESLVGRFVYESEKNRAVAVHAGAIVHALRAVYGAGPLADELDPR